MSDQAQGAEPQNTTPQGGTTPQTAPAQPAPVDVSEAVQKGLESLFSRAGSPDRAAEILYTDNKALRDKNRELESQVQTVTQTAAESLAAYKALGDDPKAVAELLERGKAALEREHARELADVSGANARVLADRLKLDGLSAEVREVKVEGKDVRQVHIVKDGQDLGELKAYAEKHWQDYAAALFPQPQRQGVPALPQAGGSGTPQNVNPVTAALSRSRAQGEAVVSAFDFTGGTK